MSREAEVITLSVFSICSVCGEPVKATIKDKAHRHGYNRHVIAVDKPKKGFKRRLQEDSTACPGSGQTVLYKKAT